MTDGTTTDGRPNDQAAAAAAKAKVPVSTIAFGTDAGTITIPQEPMPIPVPVDKAALQDIAQTTGGHFYSAASESQLKSVYQNIGSSVGYVTEQHDISSWFIGPGPGPAGRHRHPQPALVPAAAVAPVPSGRRASLRAASPSGCHRSSGSALLRLPGPPDYRWARGSADTCSLTTRDEPPGCMVTP